MQKAIECLRQRTYQLTIDLSPGKERGFTFEGAKTHLKEGQKKTWISLKLFEN
jgi:hypothetical protein